VSEVELADCNAPKLTVTAARADGNALVVDAEYSGGAANVPLEMVQATLERAGAPIATNIAIDRTDAKHVTLRADGLAAGKYTMHLSARGALPTAASTFVATPLLPASRADTLVYQIMIDR